MSIDTGADTGIGTGTGIGIGTGIILLIVVFVLRHAEYRDRESICSKIVQEIFYKE